MILLMMTVNTMISIVIGSLLGLFIVYAVYKAISSDDDFGTGISDSMSRQIYGLVYILYTALVCIDAMVAATLSESTSHNETMYVPRLLLHFAIAGAGILGAHGLMINMKEFSEVRNAIYRTLKLDGKDVKGFVITRHIKGVDGKLRIQKEEVYSSSKSLWLFKEGFQVLASFAFAFFVPLIMFILIAKGAKDLDLLLTGIVERSVEVTKANPSGIIYTKYTLLERLPKLDYITLGSLAVFILHELFVPYLASMGLRSRSRIVLETEVNDINQHNDDEEEEEEEEKPTNKSRSNKSRLGNFSSPGGDADSFF